LIAHRENIGREAALAENFETEIASLRRQFESARTISSEIAQRLSTKRRDAAKKVNKAVEQALAGLGVANARFETKIENRKSSEDDHALVIIGKDCYQTLSHGIDFIEFQLSTNVGEDVKPLVKVASGGEVSRIMLALKTILAKTDRLPLLIFDEIDVGVSGRIAQAVGQSLKNLSQFHQVIAITHLPQIAGFADTHYVVEKNEINKRSTTRMRKLNLDERISEVAKLMSGVEVTESGRMSAKELMGLK
jgi:DNA repair protein RecN (Recombination protein N)